MKRSIPLIWYVDDLPENLESFSKRHSEVFAVKTFANPTQVVDALKKEQPDALVCDIFFYDDPVTAVEIESKVMAKGRELREFGVAIGANTEANRAGVRLIQEVTQRHKGKFPIYAFTSKGPYLLENQDFERIAESGAKWLFKGKYSVAMEQLILSQDIESYRLKNSLALRLAQHFWTAVFTSGVLGGFVVWFLTEELPRLWHSL